MGENSISRVNRGRPLREGYTLTEMLVVMVVIGLISAIIIPQTLGQMDRAKARAARMKLESVASALEMYSADLARYPTAAEGLGALVRAPAGHADWAGPYLSDASLMKDPWGQPIAYTPPAGVGGKYILTSFGADGRPGGEGFKRDIALSPSE